MSWGTIISTGMEYVIYPVYETFKGAFSSSTTKDPCLHCLITVVQLGEIWDREGEELRIKFENNQIVFLRKVDSVLDFKRSRDDIHYLQAIIGKALEMYPPNTEELRDFYERAAKGLDTLKISYEKGNGGKTATVCGILDKMSIRIRNALKGILSKEELLIKLFQKTIANQKTMHTAMNQLLTKEEDSKKDASNAASATPSKKKSAPVSSPDGLATKILEITKARESALEEEIREFESAAIPPPLQGLQKEVYDSVKNVVNEVVIKLFHANYTAAKAEAEEEIKKKEEASAKKDSANGVTAVSLTAVVATSPKPVVQKITDLTKVPEVFKMSERHLAAMREITKTYVGTFKVKIEQAQAKFLKMSTDS